MNRTLSSPFAVLALLITSTLVGCVAAGGDPTDSVENSSGERVSAVVAGDVVARAREWVNVQMPYCGGPNGGSDVLCGGTCKRTGEAANPEWDAYRSDCSGLVSYAWGLPAPGRITTTLPDVAQKISGWDLAPGDILNNSYHVVLFAGWINQSAGTATIIHEPDCGKVATELTVTLSIGSGSDVTLWGAGYTALRYVNIEGAEVPASGDGCQGITYQGSCEGNLLQWCEGGSLRAYDCGANGQVCGWQDDSVGNNCLPGGSVPQEAPSNNCGGIDYLGYCDGNTLVWCQEGNLKSYDCGGSTCAWQDSSTGYNCLQ